MRHLIKHQVNTGLLHLGMFTDRQLMPAALLVLTAVGVMVMGGSVMFRMVVAAGLLLPVGAMVMDNLSGQLLQTQVRAWLDFRQRAGVYEPGGGDTAVPYVLGEDEHSVRGASSTDLEAIFES